MLNSAYLSGLNSVIAPENVDKKHLREDTTSSICALFWLGRLRGNIAELYEVVGHLIPYSVYKIDVLAALDTSKDKETVETIRRYLNLIIDHIQYDMSDSMFNLRAYDTVSSNELYEKYIQIVKHTVELLQNLRHGNIDKSDVLTEINLLDEMLPQMETVYNKLVEMSKHPNQNVNCRWQ